jgi:hypothetical protein
LAKFFYSDYYGIGRSLTPSAPVNVDGIGAGKKPRSRGGEQLILARALSRTSSKPIARIALSPNGIPTLQEP